MQVASDCRYLSPSQLAQQYGCDAHKILGWIRRGELRAVNVGDGLQRPRYRISPADLAAFEAARAAGPTPKVSRRRRKDPLITEYF